MGFRRDGDDDDDDHGDTQHYTMNESSPANPVFTDKVDPKASPYGKIGGDISPRDHHTRGTLYWQQVRDKTGRVTGVLVSFVPLKHRSVDDHPSQHSAAASHDSTITDLYWISSDDGKRPKVSEIGDPNLTLVSLTNVAIDQNALIAGMSDDDSFNRFAYAISLLDGSADIDGNKENNPNLDVGAGGKAVVDGMAGDDILHVWHQKTVVFDGGKGSDTLSFTQGFGRIDDLADIGATVDLGKGTATNPWGGKIKLTSVENVDGFYGAANTLVGSNDANNITSGHYGDTLKGLGGDDTITVGSYFGTAGVARGLHADGGKGTDTLIIHGVFGQTNVLDLEHPENNTGSFIGSTVKDFEIYKAEFDGAALEFHGSEDGEKVLMDPSSSTNDVLDGRGGDDVLFGAGGVDTLTGGTGADRFQFKFVADSTPSTPDTITDFSHAEHDKIDLSKLIFGEKIKFIGSDDFSGHAGELHFVHQGGQTLVEMDVTGDGTSGFSILLDGTINLAKGDFLL